MEKGKYNKEIDNMLGKLVDEETASKIINNMFPEPIKGYKKGNVLTYGELKTLPEKSIIHILYYDEDNELRENDFKKLIKFDDKEYGTTDGYSFPNIELLKDDDLIENIDNSGWTYTIREAIKK